MIDHLRVPLRHAGRAAAPALLAASLLTAPAAQALPAHHGGWGLVHQTSYTTVVRCTDGFNGRASDGHPVVITAGHCGARGTVWLSEKDGHRIGTTSRRSFTRDAAANDWSIVRSAGNHALGATVVDNGVVRSVERLGKPAVGMAVCMTGRTTGTHCGRISRIKSNGIIVTTMVPHQGDSGGPLFRRIPGSSRVAALGILSYSDEKTYSAFQRLSEILDKTGVRLRQV